MKTPLLALLVALLSLLATPFAPPVEASAAILRCRSPDGVLVYTDKSCSAFGAQAAPIPGHVLMRIAEQDKLEARVSGVDAMRPLDVATPATRPGARGEDAVATRRSAVDGCARTTAQLERDIRGSFALGDVNRLAESYHWVGMGSREGQRTMDRLQHLLDQRVVDTQVFSAQIAMAGDWPDAASLGGDGGMLQLVLGDDGMASVVDFNVKHYAGCYFIQF